MATIERATKQAHKQLGRRGGTELPDFKGMKNWIVNSSREKEAIFPHKLCEKEYWTSLVELGLERLVLLNKERGQQQEILLSFKQRISYYQLKQNLPFFTGVNFTVATGVPSFWIKKAKACNLPMYFKHWHKQETKAITEKAQKRRSLTPTGAKLTIEYSCRPGLYSDMY